MTFESVHIATVQVKQVRLGIDVDGHNVLGGIQCSGEEGLGAVWEEDRPGGV